MIKYCLAILLIALTACAVGPDYKRPDTEKAAAFKENKDWKQAQPKDNVIKGKWWEVFGDPDLNALEEQVFISNQNVKAAEAAYRQANALVDESRSFLFPVITAGAGVTRGATQATGVANNYNASLAASSWEIDVWGRIRREIESSRASADASKADLAAAALSAQANLATDYFYLRIADEQKRLLARTVDNYQRSLTLTQNLYKSGVSAKSDLLQAQTQLDTARAQLIDVDTTRATLEHAIALLVGKAPANFSLPVVNSVPVIPVIPVGIPSEQLERRPDVAAAERLAMVANANIGVAKAAYYPSLTLSASGGYNSNSLADWFSLPNRVWSLGPQLAQTLFDGGLRNAQTRAAIAAYDQAVANYRQTVLASFSDVEDNLAILRTLEQEAAVQHSAVTEAEATTTIFLNQYKSGTVSYLNVVTAQNTELTDRLTELNILKQRLGAAAALIKAIGGGWPGLDEIKK